jgi:hypothetical protein
MSSLLAGQQIVQFREPISDPGRLNEQNRQPYGPSVCDDAAKNL